MDHTEFDRPSLTAVVKVIQNREQKSPPLRNRSSQQNIPRSDIREETTVQGVAVLSDN